MADKAISELVAAEQIKSTDMFVLEQDGTAKRLQGQTLLNWLTAAADGHGGISNIVKTGTDGLVDTYTITLADTTTKTFTVTNGNGLTKFEKLSTVGLVDTYQFTRSDGTYFTFAVSNGAKGDTGDASHVWIKYASQQPTVNSHSIGDNPDDWMGVYSGTAETAPTDWQAYSWYQIKGDKGDTGAPATVTGVTAEYIVSDSGTIVPSGSWSTTIPSVPQGKYLWTRSTTNFNTGDPAVSYSVSRMGIDGSGSVSSVNDKSPSDSGNVTLTAGDIQASGNASVQDELNNAVKYNTTQSLTPTQQAQARDNINAPAPYEAGDNISITGRIITTKAFPCNPKLTDNGYFGNPVNQRGGRIVPAGTPYFVPGSSTQSGVLSSPATVIGYLNAGGLYPQVKVGSETYITPIGTDVSGYVGAGYGIDRWVSGGGSLELLSGNIACTATAGGQVYRQPISPDLRRALAGEKVTLSILCSEISGNWMLTDVGGFADVHTDVKIDSELKSWTFTVAPGEDIGQLGWWAEKAGERIVVRAIGLELGTQQTLAHKEYGTWVQNEIPKFGDQLAECQRYCVAFNKYDSFLPVENNDFVVELPVPMRATPTIVNPQNIVNANVTNPTVAWYNIGSNQLRLRSTASHGGLPAVCNGLVLFSADL